jgi:hypothetical protein
MTFTPRHSPAAFTLGRTSMNNQYDLQPRYPMNRRAFVGMVAAGAASTLVQGTAVAAQPAPKARNVVLVHGLFADGSSWSEVIARLQAAGLNATAVQNPLTTLPEAIASAERVLARQDDRDRGRYASQRVGSCLCGGAGAGCRRGLHGVGQDISDAPGVRRDCLRRR